MSFGVDPIAFFVSLVAILFTWKESRRNNTVIVEIFDCQSTATQSQTENRGQMFDEFKVRVRNLGISLYDPQMSLLFRPKSGFGEVNIPLNRRSRTKSEMSEFARGMITEFGLKSYEIEPQHLPMLLSLENVSEQNTRLLLFSQGYVAKTFKVWGFLSPLVLRWNAFAYRINRKFDKKIGEHGVRLGRVFPERLLDLSIPLRFFIQRVRHPER